MLSEVLDVRKNARRQISYHARSREQTRDAFGRFLDRHDFRDGDDDSLGGEQRTVENDVMTGRMRKSAKSLLAYIAQGFKVKTMWPIFEATIQEQERNCQDQWRLLLYKYDEVILRSRHKRETIRWAEILAESVEKQVRELEIKTQLDIEYSQRKWECH